MRGTNSTPVVQVPYLDDIEVDRINTFLERLISEVET